MTGVFCVVGFVVMFLIERFVPHGKGEVGSGREERGVPWYAWWFGDGKATGSSELVRTSFVTYLGLALHNLPEGVSVAVTTASDLKLGVSICVAIMLHNVLEGMVVSLPLYVSTRGSIPQILLLTFLNGLMEPLGVLIAWSLGLGRFLDTVARVHAVLSVVAGVMACIAFVELLPGALEWILRGGGRGMSRRMGIVRVWVWVAVGMGFGWAVLGVSEWVMGGVV
ncbi:hypothetical protein HDU67_007955 [Dinochytrium kinnereticum]|nr:hypothetical protein HDU67_007955 [Dinochytrium kinnereticum]